jgi:hypothetical protein
MISEHYIIAQGTNATFLFISPAKTFLSCKENNPSCSELFYYSIKTLRIFFIKLGQRCFTFLEDDQICPSIMQYHLWAKSNNSWAEPPTCIELAAKQYIKMWEFRVLRALNSLT